MLYHKTIYNKSLNVLIYEQLKDIKTNNKDYYLYVYDYCCANKIKPNDFYIENNNSTNTWNYDLKFESLQKSTIMKESPLFGFGNYKCTHNDKFVLAKGKDHTMIKDKLYNPKIVNIVTYNKKYCPDKHVRQKVLRTSKNITEELNIFVVRNLNTNELYLNGVMCINNTKHHINRKKSKCSYNKIDVSILKDKLQNFIEYMNYIKFDYGRVELIKDKTLGWCIIDINNSPGCGVITDMMYLIISEQFKKVIM